MSEKHGDASVRHFQDAERLANVGRHDNAGHLVGFAAECAIKHAIATLSSSMEQPRLHLPELAGCAKKHLKGRSAKSMLDLLGGADFFVGWRIDQRYAATGSVDAAQYKAWRDCASRALGAAKLRAAQ